MWEMRIKTGPENNHQIDLFNKTITIMVNPGDQQAYNANIKCIAEWHLSNKLNVGPMSRFVHNIARDNTLWDAEGKWLGKNLEFACKVESQGPYLLLNTSTKKRKK